MTPDAVLAAPQRQSPIAVVFLAIRTVRRIGIAQLVVAVLFITNVAGAALFAIVPVVAIVLLVISLLAWWRYTFMVADGELRVTQGILSQRRLTMPLERIQSVSIEQQLLHRIVGLVKVSVETAGASDVEFEISAVGRPVAEAVQRVATAHRPVATRPTSSDDALDGGGPSPLPPPPPPARVLLRRTPRRLAMVALSRPALAGLAVLAPVFIFGDEALDLVGIDLPRVDGPEPALWMLWLIPVALVLIVAVGLLANLVQVMLTDWNLTLTLHDRGLLREAGLLSRRSTSTTIDRVQRIEMRRNPVEQLVGVQGVKLPTIGSGDLDLPGSDAAELDEIRMLVFDADARVATLDRQVSPKMVFLAVRNTTIVAALIAGLLVAPLGAFALLAFVLVPYTWVATRRRHRRYRWGLASHGIAKHQQFLSVHTEEMMLRKVNGVTVRQSLFERKRDLATVHLDTADGGVAIGMLPLGEANAVRDRALLVAETDRRPWM